MSGDLGLPAPPLSVRFSASDTAAQAAVCYVRKGTPTDAGPSLCGKGGFGCAYRYKRVDEFTPPSSYDPEEHSVAAEETAFRAVTTAEPANEEAVERLRSADAPSRPLLANKSSSASLRRPPGSAAKDARSQGTRLQPLKKAPSVLVAKVCRTPETGSFDELARCGALKREARDAERRLSRGDATGEHTRIVRGEARLLRYLQSAYLREYPPKDGKTVNQPIVRLLADTECPIAGNDCQTPDSLASFTTAQELAEDGAPVTPVSPAAQPEDDEEPSAGEPPPVRLLFFERLIDLDARLTASGWVRDRNMWTMEAVEQAALEIVSGLAFLHSQGVAHADIKPANLMRDAKTGQIKLLDFGASRRWVRLPNTEKENTKAVDALDNAVAGGLRPPQQGLLCEGLGSLTGTPHHCAPEVLLQACRYASADGWSRSTISDYAAHPRLMPPSVDLDLFAEAALEFDRGWGIKADIWSWGCTVLSLLGRVDATERSTTATVCPFDFSFDRLDDALEPLHDLSETEKTLPRFHMWARCFPTRITAVFRDGVVLPPKVSHLSSALQGILRQTFCQQDIRPSAQVVCEALTRRRSPVLPRRGSAQPALMAPAAMDAAAARPASPRSVASVPLPASPASSFSSRASRIGPAGVWQQQAQTSYGTTQSGPVPPSPSVAVASISMHSVNQPMTLHPNRYSLSEAGSESCEESAIGDSTAVQDPGQSNTDLVLGPQFPPYGGGGERQGEGYANTGALQLEPGEPAPSSPEHERPSRTTESGPMEGLEGPGALSPSSSVGGFLTKLRRNSTNVRRRWHNSSGAASPSHSPVVGTTGEADVQLVPGVPPMGTVPLPASLPGSPPTLAHRSSSRQLRWTMRRPGGASSTALDSAASSSVGHSPAIEPAQLPPHRPPRNVDRVASERHLDPGTPARDRSSTITPGSIKREQQPSISQFGIPPYPVSDGTGSHHEQPASWQQQEAQDSSGHHHASQPLPPPPQASSPHGLKQKLSMVFNRSSRKRGATVTRASVQSS